MKQLKELTHPRSLTSDLVLRLLEDKHAPELFSLTDNNRHYLRRWLPWLDICIKESDTLDFIVGKHKALFENKSVTLGIFYKDKIAGTISFNEIDWTEMKADIGYWIGEEYQGCGLVTRACKELIDIGFKELGLRQILILCAKENEKSHKVATRLGFKLAEIVPQGQNLYGVLLDNFIYKMWPDVWDTLNST